MPVMMSDTYDALIEAGASEPKARAVAGIVFALLRVPA